MKGSDELEGKREEGKPRTVEEERGKARQVDQSHIHRERKSIALEQRRQQLAKADAETSGWKTKGKIKCRREIARHNHQNRRSRQYKETVTPQEEGKGKRESRSRRWQAEAVEEGDTGRRRAMGED